MIYKTIVILTVGYTSCFAQTNYSTFFNDNQTLWRSVYAPSQLGRGFEKNSVQLPSGYYWSGNSFMRGGTFSDLVKWKTGDVKVKPNQTLKDKNQFFSLNNTNISGSGGEALVSYTTKIQKKDRELFALSFGIRGNIVESSVYSNNVFKLLLEGNRQYAGEEVQFSSQHNKLYSTEYFVGAAMPLKLSTDDLAIRTGLRLSYITIKDFGISSRKVLFYTAPDGRYIETKLKSYEAKSFYAHSGGFAGSGYAPSNNNGQGFGVDLGATFDIGKNLSVTASAKNFGFIKFKGDDGAYRSSIKDTFEFKMEENYFINGSRSTRLTRTIVVSHPILSNRELKGHNENFREKLAPEFLLNASYRLNEQQHTTSDDTSQYHLHNIYLTYKQGFQNKLGTTTRPEVNVAYMYNLNSIFNIGVNAGIGGFNAYKAGVFASIRGGPFVFSLASNNILGAIPKAGTGFDASMSMALNF